MADREKVIKGLENCITGFDCPPECPYLDDCNDLMKPMFVELAKDALELLKEQEAVKPKVSSTEQRCGNCNKVIEMDGWKTCPWCGKMIDWERWWNKNGTHDNA